MANTHTRPQAPKNTYPPQSPEWVYQEIMRHIEPDLMLGTIETLNEKYKTETQEQCEDRMEHYDRAFAIFDVAYAQVAEIMQDEARNLKNMMKSIAMKKEKHEAEKDLANAEKHFRDSNI